MSTPPKCKYSFFRIRKDTSIPSATKYKQLRLQALSLAPTSFSSTHEIESALTDEEWISCLSSPGTETFICAANPLANPSNATPPQQTTTTWVGQLTLHGPQTWEDFILPLESESGQKMPTPQEGTELWQMLSLYTHPDHRGRGLGKKLCREALDWLASSLYRDSPPTVWVRLMVKAENHAAVGLYQTLGFAVTGKCTLAEALIANGDGHLLPEDVSGGKYSERSGLVMVSEIVRRDG